MVSTLIHATFTLQLVISQICFSKREAHEKGNTPSILRDFVLYFMLHGIVIISSFVTFQNNALSPFFFIEEMSMKQFEIRQKTPRYCTNYTHLPYLIKISSTSLRLPAHVNSQRSISFTLFLSFNILGMLCTNWLTSRHRRLKRLVRGGKILGFES